MILSYIPEEDIKNGVTGLSKTWRRITLNPLTWKLVFFKQRKDV